MEGRVDWVPFNPIKEGRVATGSNEFDMVTCFSAYIYSYCKKKKEHRYHNTAGKLLSSRFVPEHVKSAVKSAVRFLSSRIVYVISEKPGRLGQSPKTSSLVSK